MATYIYTFTTIGNYNYLKKETLLDPILLTYNTIDPILLSEINEVIPTTIYGDGDSDNILSIIYYDKIYSIKIKENTGTFQFINVPWNFTFKKETTVTTQIEIISSTFEKSITINTNSVKFTGCTFSNSNPDPNLILFNSSAINLNLDSCTLDYNNISIPIEGAPGNILTVSNSIIRIFPSESEINIYDLFYLSTKFTFVLNPDNENTPFVFSDISKNINFKLNGDSIIQDTLYSRKCTFNLDGKNLTFKGCIFDNNINDTFLCETYNNNIITSNLNFELYNDNYNIFNPRRSQIKDNQLWNWNKDSNPDTSSINIIPSSENNFVLIPLNIPTTYNWLNNLYYFNKCFFTLGSTGTYTFGASNNKLNQILNLYISADISTEQNGNDITLTVYSTNSLNITNYSETNIFLRPLTNITATNETHCINIDDSSLNKTISIAGNYTNNNNRFIDPNITAIIGGSIVLNIVSNYNMTLENPVIIGTDNYISGNTLTTYINGANINLIVDRTTINQTGINYNFLINNVSSLGSNTDIKLPCTFTINNNFLLSGILNAVCIFNTISTIILTFYNLVVNYKKLK
jgi:hypothetical protein